MKLYSPFLITTDITGDYNFFKPYIDKLKWIDANTLYGDRLPPITGNKPMIKLNIKHFEPENYDMAMKRYIVRLFLTLGIKTMNFRSDFFLVKAGGSMPAHIDSESKVALLLPLTKNTGPLVCQDDDVTVSIPYQTLTILNTQKLHWVEPPTEDRLLFRIAIHDVLFEDLSIYKKLATNLTTI